MLRVRRAGAIIVLPAVLAVTAACGAVDPGDSADFGDSAGGSLGPRISVTFDLTGAKTVSGEQTAAAPMNNGAILDSCADYAKGNTDDDGKTFYAGAGLLDGDVDGHKVTWEMLVDDYTGPGTYPKDQLAAYGSEPSIAVDNTVYAIWPDSTSSEVVTDGDGGGTWTFQKLATTGPGGLPGAAVSGTVKWTCENS